MSNTFPNSETSLPGGEKGTPFLWGRGVNSWGGARPGAGRKPKAMQYAPVLNAVEAYFASELMNIAIEMVKRAKANNDNIAKYIMNRMFGVPAQLADSPASDRMLPYNDVNLENAVKSLIQRSEGNSALQQVFAEIYQDTICMPQSTADQSTPHECKAAPTQISIPCERAVNTSENSSSLPYMHQQGFANSTDLFGEKGTSFLWNGEVTPELRSAAIAELRRKLKTEPDHNR